MKFPLIYESSGERSLLMRIVRRGVGRAGRAHSFAFCRSVASWLVRDRVRQSIIDPSVLLVGIAEAGAMLPGFHDDREIWRLVSVNAARLRAVK